MGAERLADVAYRLSEERDAAPMAPAVWISPVAASGMPMPLRRKAHATCYFILQ